MDFAIRERAACPICAGTDFSWGSLHGHYRTRYVDDDASFLERVTVFGGVQLDARLCRGCGNVQLFVHQTAAEQPDAEL